MPVIEGQIYFGPCACNPCFGGGSTGFTPPPGFTGWGTSTVLAEYIFDFSTVILIYDEASHTFPKPLIGATIAAPLRNNIHFLDPSLDALARVPMTILVGGRFATPAMNASFVRASVRIDLTGINPAGTSPGRVGGVIISPYSIFAPTQTAPADFELGGNLSGGAVQSTYPVLFGVRFNVQ